MGVFGEKHTSLTREQKRQLINHADTHKLRPTEVCDWVLATWGLRIARVTVYSILHKQRASLMAGHRDLYQTMQNSINGAIAAASGSSYGSSLSSSFTNTQATSEDSCLDPNKSSGRVIKGRSGKRARSISCDLSTFPPLESSPGEGTYKTIINFLGYLFSSFFQSHSTQPHLIRTSIMCSPHCVLFNDSILLAIPILVAHPLFTFVSVVVLLSPPLPI